MSNTITKVQQWKNYLHLVRVLRDMDQTQENIDARYLERREQWQLEAETLARRLDRDLTSDMQNYLVVINDAKKILDEAVVYRITTRELPWQKSSSERPVERQAKNRY